MCTTEEHIARHNKNPQWGIHGIYISRGNNKMGMIPSFSTMPIRTCAGNVPCAKDCYAVKLARIFRTVRETWEANTKAVQEGRYDEIEADIDAYIQASKRPITAFRWNVSGDIYDAAFLAMMVRVAEANPAVTFMAFTKRYELIPPEGGLPANLRIVLSAWKCYRPSAYLAARYPVAYFDDGSDDCAIPTAAYHCGGNCERCLKCFTMDAGSSVYFTKH